MFDECTEARTGARQAERETKQPTVLDVGGSFNDPVTTILRRAMGVAFFRALDLRLKAHDELLTDYGIVCATVEGGSVNHFRDVPRNRSLHGLHISLKGGAKFLETKAHPGKAAQMRMAIKNIIRECVPLDSEFGDLPLRFLSPMGLAKIRELGVYSVCAMKTFCDDEIQQIVVNGKEYVLTEREIEILEAHKGSTKVLLTIEISDYAPIPLLNPKFKETGAVLDIMDPGLKSVQGLVVPDPRIDFTLKMFRATRPLVTKSTDLLDLKLALDNGDVDLEDPLVRKLAIIHMAALGYFPNTLSFKRLDPTPENITFYTKDLARRMATHEVIGEKEVVEMLEMVKTIYKKVLSLVETGNDPPYAFRLKPNEIRFHEQIQHGVQGVRYVDARALLQDSCWAENADLIMRIDCHPGLWMRIEILNEESKKNGRQQQKIGVAIIGFREIGEFHAKFLDTNSNTCISAICDPRFFDAAGRSTRFFHETHEKYPHAHLFSSARETIHHPDVHAVAITSPTPFYYELAQEALRAGKHCVVEKTMIETVQAAEALASLANEKNTRFVTDLVQLLRGKRN